MGIIFIHSSKCFQNGVSERVLVWEREGAREWDSYLLCILRCLLCRRSLVRLRSRCGSDCIITTSWPRVPIFCGKFAASETKYEEFCILFFFFFLFASYFGFSCFFFFLEFPGWFGVRFWSLKENKERRNRMWKVRRCLCCVVREEESGGFGDWGGYWRFFLFFFTPFDNSSLSVVWIWDLREWRRKATV